MHKRKHNGRVSERKLSDVRFGVKIHLLISGQLARINGSLKERLLAHGDACDSNNKAIGTRQMGDCDRSCSQAARENNGIGSRIVTFLLRLVGLAGAHRSGNRVRHCSRDRRCDLNKTNRINGRFSHNGTLEELRQRVQRAACSKRQAAKTTAQTGRPEPPYQQASTIEASDLAAIGLDQSLDLGLLHRERARQTEGEAWCNAKHTSTNTTP